MATKMKTKAAAPAWAPSGATLLYEIRSGGGDLAAVVLLCGNCGKELLNVQTDIPRTAALHDEMVEAKLAGGAILRLGRVRCCPGCGHGPLPGPTVTGRIELPGGGGAR